MGLEGMPVIVACTKPGHIGVKAWSQGCGTRLVASAWLGAAADRVDVMCEGCVNGNVWIWRRHRR